MPNRAERRANRKAMPAWKRQTKEQKMAALVRNGITPQDIKREGERSYNEGYKAGVDAAFKTCYAAACLAANDVFGFGRKRCYKLLCALDGHVLNTLVSVDAINAVFERMGLRLDFSGAIDRIESEV